MSNKKGKKLNNAELSELFGQFLLILRSGISIKEGADVLATENSNPREVAALESLSEALAGGNYIYKAMEKTGCFPKYSTSIVKMGEETGTMDETMEYLQRHHINEDEVNKSLRSSILFPVIMAVMMLIIIVILMVFVMPVFRQVYAQLGADLSGLARVFLDLGSKIGDWGIPVIIVIVGLIVIGVVLSKFPRGLAAMKKAAFAVGFMKKTRTFKEISRISAGLSRGLYSGMDMEESLQLAASLAEEKETADALNEACVKLENGISKEQIMRELGIYSGVSMRMISVGMNTGTLPSVLEQISDNAREEMYTHLYNTMAILEPSIVVALALIVGIILCSVLLPLIGIISGI